MTDVDRPFEVEGLDQLREIPRLARAVMTTRIADAEGVPAYIVFSDAVLRQMAAAVPKSPSALLGLSGVGPVKLERYGGRFLELLSEH